jgi:hypothetical protein
VKGILAIWVAQGMLFPKGTPLSQLFFHQTNLALHVDKTLFPSHDDLLRSKQKWTHDKVVRGCQVKVKYFFPAWKYFAISLEGVCVQLSIIL